MAFDQSGKYTSAFMAGNILVSAVFVQSNQSLSTGTEALWTDTEISTALGYLENACDWWENMWNENGYVGGLSFTIDTEYVTSPYRSSYNPIDLSSDSTWINEFLRSMDYSGSKTQMLYDYTNDNIDMNGSDFAFTVFFVKADNDADHKFANGNIAYTSGGGSNSSNTYTAVAYSDHYSSEGYSGYYEAAIAHEIAHIFGAGDEYQGTNTYTDVFGYYGIQNTNAYDGNPNPENIVESLMNSSMQNAYNDNTSSPESLQMIGWRDTDEDGIIDVLDVPLEISSFNSEYNLESGDYSFSALISVGYYPRYTGSRNVTINSVDQLLYRYGDENDSYTEWVSLREGLLKAESVMLNASFNIAEGHCLEWKAVDADGTTSTKTYHINGISGLSANIDHEIQSASFAFAPASADTGIVAYQLKVGEAIYELGSNTEYVLSSVAYGNYSWSLRGKYSDTKFTTWKTGGEFSVCPAVLTSSLVGDEDGMSWQPVSGFAKYVIQYSQDNFESCIQIKISASEYASLNLAGGNWKWRVAVDGYDVWSNGQAFTSTDPGSDVKVIAAENDGLLDVFFARVQGVWDEGYFACHVGEPGKNNGIGTILSIAGKNRIADVFQGSDDANMLVLTDDANGDVILLDDLYSEFPGDERVARLSKITKIVAGAGNDIIDLTSRDFACSETPVICGGTGNDVIWGGGGGNVLIGDEGHDTLIGGSGNDVLIGGVGYDDLRGLGGSDIYVFDGNWGYDWVTLDNPDDFRLYFPSLSSAFSIEYFEDYASVTDGNNVISVYNIASNGLDGKILYADFNGEFAGYSASYIKSLLA